MVVDCLFELMNATVSLNANNGLCPLALAWCEEECSDSRRWFLTSLSDHIGGDELRIICFMYDRMKDYTNGIKEVFPNSFVYSAVSISMLILEVNGVMSK